MTEAMPLNMNKLSIQLPRIKLICFVLYITVPLWCAQSIDVLEHVRLYNSVINTSLGRFPPALSRGDPVKVHFGFNLINIVEVNAKKQFITVYGWVMQKWNNHLLKWNPADYHGLETLHVDSEKIWVPDILLYNNLDEQDRVGGGRSTYKTQVVIDSNGTNTWHSPAMFKSFCRINVEYFPLDNQTCVLTFGSWTHDVHTIDLQPVDIEFPTTYYSKNGEWSVFNVSFFRKKWFFSCCEDPYIVLQFAMYIKREAFDYLINLIIPCCLISSMIFLGFILPPESGERIGLSITVLLAMTVFQQLTSEIMPAYDFPILGQYYFAIVLEISASLVATTIILNFYHRTNRKMPSWIRKLLFHWLSRLVLLHGEVSERYPYTQCTTSNAIRNLNMQNSNCTNGQRPQCFKVTMRKRNDTVSGESCAGYDCPNTDNMFSNEHALDKEGMEMGGLPQVSTYPFSMVDMDTKEKKRNQEQDISETEREMRHWEWTLGARILDRCVFIVAIVIGVMTVMAVFLRAPSLWKNHKEVTVQNAIHITHNFES